MYSFTSWNKAKYKALNVYISEHCKFAFVLISQELVSKSSFWTSLSRERRWRCALCPPGPDLQSVISRGTVWCNSNCLRSSTAQIITNQSTWQKYPGLLPQGRTLSHCFHSQELGAISALKTYARMNLNVHLPSLFYLCPIIRVQQTATRSPPLKKMEYTP